MSKITTIGNVIIAIAADKNDDLGKVLRQLPSIQKELLKREIITLEDLTNEQIEVLMEEVYQEEFAGKDSDGIQNLSKDANLEDWIDGQEVMIKLRISPRTLQTLRSNGTIPFTRIGHKLYYLKQDIERILRNNYVMFNIRKRYGEDY
jgi:hypothetical protein